MAPRKPFATLVAHPTNSVIFQHAFLDLWTLKHNVEDRGHASTGPLFASAIASDSSAAGACVRRSVVFWVMGEARTPEVAVAST